MNKNTYVLICIAVMAGTTYLIRVIPMLVFRKRIKSVFVQSFLFYVPYSVLSAMTFPAIFSCTGNMVSALGGTAAAMVLASKKKGLVTVAIGAAAAALILQMLFWIFLSCRVDLSRGI